MFCSFAQQPKGKTKFKVFFETFCLCRIISSDSRMCMYEKVRFSVLKMIKKQNKTNINSIQASSLS